MCLGREVREGVDGEGGKGRRGRGGAREGDGGKGRDGRGGRESWFPDLQLKPRRTMGMKASATSPPPPHEQLPPVPATS